MKLSLMVPTYNSAATIERTLGAVIAQAYRPLEVVVYDEASSDATRQIVDRVLAGAPGDVETRLLTAEENSGPVRAWRVPLHAITGRWCTFVWADDVLDERFSDTMMAGAQRAAAAGRAIVACSGQVETADGDRLPYYATDAGLATAVEYSEGIFLRRFPLTQVCAAYEVGAAREVFDRHIDIRNPRGYDYARQPYGNDVGYLSELAMHGEGVELLGERLVTLVDSAASMTRRGTRDHKWQMRWQYTYNQYRVWTWWARGGVPGAERVRAMAGRRLALCSLMLGGDRARVSPDAYVRALLAYRDFRRLDYQVRGVSLEEHRRLVRS